VHAFAAALAGMAGVAGASGTAPAGSDAVISAIVRDLHAHHGRSLVVAVRTANKVAVVDLGAMKVAHVIDVPAAPQEVLMRPDGQVAYVSCDTSHKIAVIRTSDWTVES